MSERLVERLRNEGRDAFATKYSLGMAALCSEAADEIERLRACVAAIQRATVEGRVCDDVAWFDQITTLHDYCALTLERTADQMSLPLADHDGRRHR